jgi:hypothetical protein
VRLTAFEERAAHMWEEIPATFREGIDALVVDEDLLEHPDIPGVYTLGECVTDHWPDGYSSQGEVRSRILLHHGSFAALAGRGEGFDWDRELWETILHEILHHREFSASQEGLERYDEAVDQDFRRRAGRSFDPAFYHAVPAAEDGSVRIESDIFLEIGARPDAGTVAFDWRGRRYTLNVPVEEAVQYVRVTNLAGGRLWVVVWRDRPWWRRLTSFGPPSVREMERHAQEER